MRRWLPFVLFTALVVACGDSGDETTTTTSASAGSGTTGAPTTGDASGTTAAGTGSGTMGGGSSMGGSLSTGGASSTGDAVGEGCAEHVTFATINTTIFTGCGGYNACHEKGPFGGSLDLSPANAYANVVGVASSIAPSVLRVAPGSSQDSLLYRKLIDDLAADDSEGGPMPKNALASMWTRLPDEQIELVRCWIDEGAPMD